MNYEIRLCRPEEIEKSWEVEKAVWSPFNWEAAGSVGADYTDNLHLVAINENNEMIATIDGCPIVWDGSPETLPEGGWTDVVLALHEPFKETPEYACALGASILPDQRRGGLAGELLKKLKKQALDLGYKGLLAPVRPSARWRMPHLTIEEYADVRLEDNRHFDPWVRVHESIGGKIIGTCLASAEFSAPRSNWEQWANMKLPDNGQVIIDGSIGVLELLEGWGYLAEDSIWLLHQ